MTDDLKKKLNIEEDREKHRLYYIKNKDRIIARRKLYIENNRERVSEYYKKYKEKNKERYRETHIKYYSKNKEKLAQCSREYYNKNKERILKNNKLNREKNKTSLKEFNKLKISKNKEYYSARSRLYYYYYKIQRNKMYCNSLIENNSKFLKFVERFNNLIEYLKCEEQIVTFYKLSDRTKEKIISVIKSFIEKHYKNIILRKENIESFKKISTNIPTKKEKPVKNGKSAIEKADEFTRKIEGLQKENEIRQSDLIERIKNRKYIDINTNKNKTAKGLFKVNLQK